MTPAPTGMHPNLWAFLTMIGMSEGTITHPFTRDDGYDVVVTGEDEKGRAAYAIFTDYSTHPFCVVPKRPLILVDAKQHLFSDAAGRYQIMARFYAVYKVQLRLPDFGHDSQNQIAIQMIKECHALDDIKLGHFDVAVRKVHTRWASLPGANYPGQHMNPLADLRLAYTKAGGTVAA